MSTPTITALYAGILAILVVLLGTRIAYNRFSKRVGIGDGGDAQLGRMVRVHGNAAENVPLALVLLLLAELIRTPDAWLHGFGIALVAGRVLHAYGLSASPGTTFGRFVGTFLTWGTMLALAALLIVRSV